MHLSDDIQMLSCSGQRVNSGCESTNVSTTTETTQKYVISSKTVADVLNTKTSSASAGFAPDPHRGLCPWTLGDRARHGCVYYCILKIFPDYCY